MDDSVPKQLIFHPLDTEHWDDLVTLFGKDRGCGGCWCMWWRLSRADFQRMIGDPNRQAFASLAKSGAPLGLLGYFDEKPVGWIAIAPREHYSSLERSRILKRVDNQPVWSITCIFINRGARHSGMTTELIRAAVKYAASQGAECVEAYPVIRGDKPISDANAYTGYSSTYLKLGFIEAGRNSPGRPIMRFSLKPQVEKSE